MDLRWGQFAVVAKPREHQRLHRHHDARLILFLSGELSESSFDRSGGFTRGELLFRPAFFGHADQAGELGSTYVHLPTSLPAVRRHVKRRGWVPLRGRIAINGLNLETLLSSPAAGDRLLESLDGAAYKAPAAETPLSAQLRRLAIETDVQISDLSDSLDVPPYEFTRRFMREFGLTPMAYRRQARLQRAMHLLAEGGISLAQIAAASGHFDQSHLSRDLKRETGLTPLGFRTAAGVR